MKFRISVSFLLIIFAFISCKDDNPNLNNTTFDNFRKENLLQPITPVFGIMSLNLPNDDMLLISQNGPTGNGWNGILVNINSNEITAAKNAGYYPIVGTIYRPNIVNNKDAELQAEITLGKNFGVDWFYIDDGLSGGGITNNRIDYVASLVHSSPWKPLASAEWSQESMSANPNWHNNVDIIMPYRYQFSYSQLQSFFQFVKTNYVDNKYKKLVPILGYYAIIGSDTLYQKGSASGDTAFIELARSYTTNSIVFYYHDWWYDTGWHPIYLTKVNALTNYLQSYYALGGSF